MRRFEAMAMALVGGDSVRVSTGTAWVTGLGAPMDCANTKMVAGAIGRCGRMAGSDTGSCWHNLAPEPSRDGIGAWPWPIGIAALGLELLAPEAARQTAGTQTENTTSESKSSGSISIICDCLS